MPVNQDPGGTHATVLATGIYAVRSALSKVGIEPQTVERRVGIDPDYKPQPDDHISLKKMISLYEDTAVALGNDAFGVQTGFSVPVGAVTSFDYVALAAPTLGDALRNWVRFQGIPSNSIPLHFEEEGNFAYLRWEICDSFGPRAQMTGVILGIAAARIQYLMNKKILELKAEFSHKKPRNADSYVQIFGPDVKFNMPADRIGIPISYLVTELHSSEPNLLRMAEKAALQELSEREKRSDQLFVIANQISNALKQGDASLEAVARNLGVSRRSLQRTLEKSETTYRTLVDDVRKKLATRYLKEADLQLSEIAYLLGYSELSAFSRAARVWFGMSPRAFRDRCDAEAGL